MNHKGSVCKDILWNKPASVHELHVNLVFSWAPAAQRAIKGAPYPHRKENEDWVIMASSSANGRVCMTTARVMESRKMAAIRQTCTLSL